MDLQAELACRDEGISLNSIIELTIHFDNLLCTRHPSRFTNPTNPIPEPMQLGYTPLQPEERERRRQMHLCLYCGQAGHFKVNCPVRPASTSSKAMSSLPQHSYSSNCLKIPIQLIINERDITTHALLDSGAAGNFMSDSFVKEHNISLTT